MKAKILSSLFVLGILAAPAWAGTVTAGSRTGTLTPVESASLRAIEEAGLGDLRAGAVAKTARIQDVERAALVSAEASSPGLADLRGGDYTISEHDLKLIAIVLVIIIVIIII